MYPEFPLRPPPALCILLQGGGGDDLLVVCVLFVKGGSSHLPSHRSRRDMQQAIAHRFEKTLHPFPSIDPSHRSVAINFSMAHLQHSCLLMKQSHEGEAKQQKNQRHRGPRLRTNRSKDVCKSGGGRSEHQSSWQVKHGLKSPLLWSQALLPCHASKVPCALQAAWPGTARPQVSYRLFELPDRPSGRPPASCPHHHTIACQPLALLPPPPVHPASLMRRGRLVVLGRTLYAGRSPPKTEPSFWPPLTTSVPAQSTINMSSLLCWTDSSRSFPPHWPVVPSVKRIMRPLIHEIASFQKYSVLSCCPQALHLRNTDVLPRAGINLDRTMLHSVCS